MWSNGDFKTINYQISSQLLVSISVVVGAYFKVSTNHTPGVQNMVIVDLK